MGTSNFAKGEKISMYCGDHLRCYYCDRPTSPNTIHEVDLLKMILHKSCFYYIWGQYQAQQELDQKKITKEKYDEIMCNLNQSLRSSSIDDEQDANRNIFVTRTVSERMIEMQLTILDELRKIDKDVPEKEREMEKKIQAKIDAIDIPKIVMEIDFEAAKRKGNVQTLISDVEIEVEKRLRRIEEATLDDQ